MTQTLSVRCQNCGSSLQVGETVRFLTCGYCHSELQVVRDATTVHTEVFQRIEQNTQTTVNQLKVIDIQNEIERLDREWQMWREKNLDRNEHGVLIDPLPPSTQVTVAATALLGLMIGVMVMILLIASSFPWYFSILVVPVAVAVLFITQAAKEEQDWYSKAKAKYEKTRTQLLKDLAQARHP